MGYAIVFNQVVQDQIKNLPGNIKAVVRQQIALLSETPSPTHSKELDGHPHHFRIWLGAKYRLVWSVDDENRLVRIRYVGPKIPDLYVYLGLGRSTNRGDES